ncbi:MAG: transcription termination factor NusA [Phycisphaerae bacterium]|nr:transcription termination factor NusA [Phycisphaerae bacterium]
MSQDLLRIVDGICREKNIERESFIGDLENAIAAAIRKAYGETAEVEVKLDPLSGSIGAVVDGTALDMATLGRIAAQTAKQVIIQKTRERERNSIFEEFTERRGTIMTGTVVRAERGNLLVNLSRTEGFLPRSEQIPGETHAVGARIRVLILEVREQGNQVKVILSRSHPEFIQRLFELEVPEVAERIIEIKALAREAGYRSKVAVSSIDSKVDAVGACVGVRGSRIKNIVDELSGEKIDIVRWNESSQILIQNSLKPAEVQEIALCFELNKATVVVTEDQLSLAIGKRGQNVRLGSRLTKWDIDILTPAEYNKNLEIMDATVKSVEGVDDVVVDKLVAIGCVSVADIDEVGPEPLVEELELEPALAERIVVQAGEEAIRQEELKEAAAKKKAEEAAAMAKAPREEKASAFIEADEESGAAEPSAETSPTEGLLDADTISGPVDDSAGPGGLSAGSLVAGSVAGAQDEPETSAFEPEDDGEAPASDENDGENS